MTTRVAFLSRGHGYGHAARDRRIIRALRLCGDVEVTLASSGTGLEYYSCRGMPCTDLGLSDNQDLNLTASRRVLRFLTSVPQPDVVVSDELFCIPVLCQGLRVRSLMITDFFWAEVGRPDLDRVFAGCSGVILTDFAEAHPDPPRLPVPLHITGPVVDYIKLTKDQARSALGVAAPGTVMTIAFGSAHGVKTSFSEPAIDRILAAWATHSRCGDILFALLPPRLVVPESCGTVAWIGCTDDPDTYYRASDVVFSLAGLTMTLGELARNGIPTVCFTSGTPPPSVAHLRSAELLHTVDLDAGPDEVWQVAGLAKRHAAELPARRERLQWANPERIANLIRATAHQTRPR